MADANDAVDRRIARQAKELLDQDAALDDEVFMPPAAIGLLIDSPRPPQAPDSPTDSPD